ncbi:histidinol-phosphatase [Pectobacterium wasabiae]|uniref:Histidinol-phosphatase n=1 Tax=Pectobacterium wasabiae TaxID=55208 RepID=A0AAW3EBB8_9GAMM|nr:histidinol-phosphatase [Pectobacterium wasabiae]AOR65450.1 histidinol-phosphatase [Pectobacterium wasabiae CFBP 3304]EJS93276.1 Histidinol-phosphate phosphatase [Pectobacterium wasabiae CFBP 3304]KFX02542.1 inositol monophosphatase [Pectobacterium wasabiae]KGA26491.1 inositol monophosphatase [Pectobacterium wasabiae]
MSQTLPDIAFFHELAALASQETLPRFRSLNANQIETKPKEGFRFDPVTEADRQAERVMREHITRHYPEHAIMGEEFGLSGEGPVRWVLDPVDGTRPFLCGLPVWGTLIGLLHHERAVMGMMSQPFTGECFWADGLQAWRSDRQGETRLSTRKGVSLKQAILHTTAPEALSMHPTVRFAELTESTLMTRYGGECYALAMLAAGQIDICVEFALQPYDIVALIPIIEQAGGVITDLNGQRAEAGGTAVATGSPELHQQVLAILNGTR